MRKFYGICRKEVALARETYGAIVGLFRSCIKSDELEYGANS